MKNLIDKLINAGIEEIEAKKEISILEKEFKDKNKIQEIVNERIKTRKPIQYLIGKAFFMDFEVTVTPQVLIPRPETEILVEEVVRRLKSTNCHPEGVKRPKDLQTIKAIDIGTGTGIIPIALVRLIPDIKIYAIDLEREVIDLALENARKYGVDQKIHFKICDLFSNEAEKLFQTYKFDLVISNPPYVKQSRGVVTTPLQPEIAYEPKIALSGSKENMTGLVYYERILKLAKKYDVRLIALEIDPPLVIDLKNLLIKEGLNKFEVVKDYAKLDRCLFVYLNPQFSCNFC